ncbi:FAD-binding oxidoreductase [Streptomyces sp. MP131-18]|uniref:FAD-binding oxidoreductase n=1 Tax=Streptomyces sp. MP131-18 TaxID=1857892 RepID=UPI00097BE07E|nr:FAD-binding oxidoreductase [Streptomyces sp. MP131-18]ONK15246.1 Mitomycin radical oxidase [Streptomyces sp. MP131-18]
MNDITHQLDARVRGPVYRPGADRYDAERTGFQLLDPHRPSAIVAADGAEDVRAAVAFAAGHRMPLAVQSRGHGRAAPAGGVLISTRRMSGVRVDPLARTAWVEAGASWGQVIEAAAPYGLAPLSGSFPGVGAVPYTLGGGVGLLARRYGFAADHVHRLDVVTADARLRRVTADSDPDLFWALRGGGGSFGVVTGMEIGLVPAARFYGGSLCFDVGEAPDVLDAWHRWTADVPEEMTSAVTTLPYPDVPELPAALRGRQVAHIQIACLTTQEEGSRLVEPLRSIGPVLLDTLRELPYADSGTVFDEPDQPHAYRSRNVLVRDLAPEALAHLTKAAAGPPAPVMAVVGLRHLGGALARAPRVAGAVGHREAAYLVTILSPVGPGEGEVVRATHREALSPFAGDVLGISLNFAFGPLGEEEIRSAFAPAAYERLTELRAAYDPHGLLHVNHAIPAAR